MSDIDAIRELPAKLIAQPAAPTRGAPFMARHVFDLSGSPVAARLYSTSLGSHQLFVNGVRTDDELLKPGWTAYRHRVTGEARDVLALLRDGANVLVMEVAGGWYTEDFGHLGNKGHWYGEQPAGAAILEIRFPDGRLQTISTDDSWVTTTQGPLRASSIYDGETYDARRRNDRIHTPCFTAVDWSPAIEAPALVDCVPRTAPPVRVTQHLQPIAVERLHDGRYLVDFGQNLVGRLRIRVTGSAGQQVTLRHAEVLDGGELATMPLRAARATDVYILTGDDQEEWAPEFTFHGFRFAEVSGWPEAELLPASLTAEVIGTDLARTGWFTSSSALLNKFHENVVWSARGNFLSIPSDCPQRDERLGWTGDIQVFTPTAATLFDVRGFLENWLEDLRLEQAERGGTVPVLVPDPLHDILTPVAGWGDAATTVPWALYQRYGDADILRTSLPSMCEWLRVVRSRMRDGVWQGDFQFGDWLDPAAPPADPGLAMTDHDLVATAYAFRSASIVAESAAIIGAVETETSAREWAAQIRLGFLARFATPRGLLVSDSVAAYTIALAFGLAAGDSELRSHWNARLFSLVRKAGYRISTGFLATPLLCDMLADGGHPKAALRVLLQTKHPSWLAPVLRGATTVWERWDSLLEDGGVNPGQMTSFNHYALGAVVDFVHRRVAGIAPASPGYKKIEFAPLAPTELTSASSSLETPNGRAAIAWDVQGAMWTLRLRVPAGVDAVFINPFTAERTALEAGEHVLLLAIPTLGAQWSPLDGLDTALSTVIDDPEAYEAVVATLAQHDRAAVNAFELSKSWIDERTVGSTLVFLPRSVQAAVDARLRDLARRRSDIQSV